MLKKGTVISNALLLLGEVKNYNNNNYEMYKVAMQFIETVLDDIGANPSFRANALETKLSLAKMENGKYYYNKPIEMLSIIKSFDKYKEPKGFEIIGEYIVSDCEDLEVLYCKSIPIEDYPKYYSEYISLCLAEKLAEAYTQFNNKLQYIIEKKKKKGSEINIIEAPRWRKYI